MRKRKRPHLRLVWICVLLFISVRIFAQIEAGKVQQVSLFSESVNRAMKYNIYLPEDYNSSEKRYPVLYLLHGLTSNYLSWAFMGAPMYAEEHGLILVMPDVGNSWYVNWAKNEEGQKNNWEDFIIKDLITHVDSEYRTIAQREGRAVNGLSMGGYGAIMLGLRHPDLFCSIGSHSGVMGYARRQKERLENGEKPWVMWEKRLTDKPNPLIGIEGFTSQVERTPEGQIFLSGEDCDACDPFKLVLQIPKEILPHIYIDCGTEDRQISGNRKFIHFLEEKNIPFTHAQSKGGHEPTYWAREVGHSMAVQYHIIQRNLKQKK